MTSTVDPIENPAIHCAECARVLGPDAKFCDKCGAQASSDKILLAPSTQSRLLLPAIHPAPVIIRVKQCPHCAEDIKAEANFCKHCKQTVNRQLSSPKKNESRAETDRDQILKVALQDELARSRKGVGVAYLLYIFAGTIGVHKFYLGCPFQGTFYLLCFLFGWVLWIPFVPLGFCVLWDLFTLPGQVAQKTNRSLRRSFVPTIEIFDTNICASSLCRFFEDHAKKLLQAFFSPNCNCRSSQQPGVQRGLSRKS